MAAGIEMEERPVNLREESTQVIQTTVNKFFDRTSLPAVPVIRGSTSSWRKFLWLAFIVLGFSMAIYQSIDLIEGYRKYRTLSITSEKINSSIPFPAITICPALPILWEKAKRHNHSIYEYFKDKKTPSLLDIIKTWSKNGTVLKDPFDDLLDKILLLNESERMSFLPESKNVILSIYHPKQHSLNESFLIETYIPAYGKCFTFNPGLSGDGQVFVKNTEYIEFLIYDEEKNKPPSMKNVGILINLHTPGTAPELESGSVLYVKGKQDIYVIMTRNEINRLPSPYPSNCVDGTEAERRKKNPFYTPEKPYLYTRRACKDKFMQEFFQQQQNCSVPNFPLRNDTNITQICTEDMLAEEIPKANNCPLACHQMNYKWMPIVTYSPVKEGYINDFCEYLAEDKLKEYLEEMGTTKEEFKDGVSRLIFKIQSGLYTSHTEHPKYTFGDILGAIGGNIGLWIGISIVSFFEVCELIFVIFLKIIRLIGRKCWSGIKRATGHSARQE